MTTVLPPPLPHGGTSGVILSPTLLLRRASENEVRLSPDGPSGGRAPPDAATEIREVRQRLALDASVGDATIRDCLDAIRATTDSRGRWMAAFGSELGRHLSRRGTDLNTALNTILALVPEVRC